MAWERQFGTDNDFPPAPMRVQYALCTTGRSGSHFLGHLMHQRGVFGYPLEYMNPNNLRRWEQRAAEASASDVLTYIKSIRTSPNGCFGIKLHHSHLARFLQHESRANVLKYRFVMLTRQDLVAQAASTARATQTGAWISEMPEKRPATYDWSLIRDKLESIVSANAAWAAFLHSLAVDCLALTYEAVRDDPPAALEEIAEFVGIELPRETAESFMPAPQSPGSDWAERFIADSKKKFAASARIAGVPSPQTPSAWRRIARRLLS